MEPEVYWRKAIVSLSGVVGGGHRGSSSSQSSTATQWRVLSSGDGALSAASLARSEELVSATAGRASRTTESSRDRVRLRGG